ncbi:methyl-accepting chemotaxis protein [Paenibacillus agricola]|uniref:Methyl-accepting chemotaxis protein n=1 Tax=Paenibacillus agricola TaxID=2716264 RepID=A0ABX0JEC1_9BACL|nr:methyl-accepting chemotaxis protein [Paenibacillus agricola]NHN32231.1 methyl-accepting chemotaxis protein [Paenibacillus agricola]
MGIMKSGLVKGTGSINLKSIKSKLILSFTAVLLIPSLVVGLTAYNAAKSKVEEQMSKAAQSNVQLFDRYISETISQTVLDAEHIANSITPDMYEGGDKAKAYEVIKAYKALHPEIDAVLLGTKDGRFFREPNQVAAGFDPRTRPWFIQGFENAGKAILMAPSKSANTGGQVVIAVKTTKDQSGVFGIQIDLNQLSKSLEDIKIGNNGYIQITDQAKIMIAASKNIVNPGEEYKGGAAEALYSSDSGVFRYTSTESSEDEIAYYVTNKFTGWKIAGILVDQEIQDEVNGILYTTLIVLVIAIAVGVLIMLFIIRSINKPLSELMHLSKAISGGDLTQPIILNTKDEFGDLGSSFEKMRLSLRKLIHEVGDTSSQLAAASEQLSASAEETSESTAHVAESLQGMAAGAEQQLGSVASSGTIIGGISSSVQEISANLNLLSANANTSLTRSKEGGDSVAAVIQQMESIAANVDNLSKDVKELGSKSTEIGNIIKVITEIATQTNLLSLNAAIEAARAGEHGQGFAVVASEVRKLAEDTANSAKKISQLVSDTQLVANRTVTAVVGTSKEVGNGLGLVRHTGQLFVNIQNSISEVDKQTMQVHTNAQEISIAVENMVQSFETITEIAIASSDNAQTISAASQQQLASMEEVTANAESLSKMAEVLQSLIDRFKV